MLLLLVAVAVRKKPLPIICCKVCVTSAAPCYASLSSMIVLTPVAMIMLVFVVVVVVVVVVDVAAEHNCKNRIPLIQCRSFGTKPLQVLALFMPARSLQLILSVIMST